VYPVVEEEWVYRVVYPRWYRRGGIAQVVLPVGIGEGIAQVVLPVG